MIDLRERAAGRPGWRGGDGSGRGAGPFDGRDTAPAGGRSPWLVRAAALGLVELIDGDSVPTLRRALGIGTGRRDELLAVRIAPGSVHTVEQAWMSFPVARLTELAPLIVDLSSLRLPAATAHALLQRLTMEGGEIGRLSLVAGSVNRRAELYSITRPRLAVFTTIADAMQALVFAGDQRQRTWVSR